MGDVARRLADDRAAARAQVFVNIDLFSEHNFWSGLTMNMSEGGVFVATHHVVPVGSILVVHLTLPYEDKPIITMAEVRWTRAWTGDEDAPPGIGLQFVSLDDGALRKIRHFVATVREPLFFDD